MEKKRGLPRCSKKGEAICDDKVINFFEDEQHKNVFAQLFKILVGNQFFVGND